MPPPAILCRRMYVNIRPEASKMLPSVSSTLTREHHMQSSILLVDDDRLQLELVALILRGEGYAPVHAFGCPRKALDHARNNRPALLITDYCMPVYTGAQLYRKLLCLYPELPAIMITGTSLNLLGCIGIPIIQKGSGDFFDRLRKEVKQSLMTNGNHSLL